MLSTPKIRKTVVKKPVCCKAKLYLNIFEGHLNVAGGSLFWQKDYYFSNTALVLSQAHGSSLSLWLRVGCRQAHSMSFQGSLSLVANRISDSSKFGWGRVVTKTPKIVPCELGFWDRIHVYSEMEFAFSLSIEGNISITLSSKYGACLTTLTVMFQIIL